MALREICKYIQGVVKLRTYGEERLEEEKIIYSKVPVQVSRPMMSWPAMHVNLRLSPKRVRVVIIQNFSHGIKA